jgi:hypothetical protein
MEFLHWREGVHLDENIWQDYLVLMAAQIPEDILNN